MSNLKKTCAVLLLLMLVLTSATALAKPTEITLNGLTLQVPEEYAVFESERDESTVLTLQKGDVIYSLTAGTLEPPEIDLSLVYFTLADGFFTAMDPEYVLESEETLYTGQTEVRLFTARVKLSGAEVTAMLLCRFADENVALFSVVPLDGSVPERAQLEELLAMIEKPKLYRKGLTEEPVK